MVKIYYAYTGITEDKSIEEMGKDLPLFLVSKFQKLRRDEDRRLLYLSMALLTKALCENGYNNFRPGDLQYSEAGRPFFPNAPFDFNISHTDGCAAVAFSDDCRVGIDVEKIKAIDFSDFTGYFTSEQWNDIHDADDKLIKFYYYWTLIESGAKADGRGLSLVFSESLKLTNGALFIDNVKWHYNHLNFDPLVSCCLTAGKNHTGPEVINIKSI
ncbi:MAG TPA: 4'-phosphopantetheinyl transferase superfamily protein [Ignavibacteriales bacterium]|nr:4'-phosphopantetheinyl transferase superfamily protein [Ignavibacteriales bacterium]